MNKTITGRKSTISPISGFLALMIGWILLLAGCASLTTPLDPPNVSMDSFSSLPSESGAPRFLIKLRVQNPNEQTLDIAGVSYSIALMGQEVITGVSNEVPVIEGYSEGIVSLEANLKLFQLLRLLASLGQAETDELTYRFTAKIDFKGLVPTQRVEQEGLISLKQKVTLAALPQPQIDWANMARIIAGHTTRTHQGQIFQNSPCSISGLPLRSSSRSLSRCRIHPA